MYFHCLKHPHHPPTVSANLSESPFHRLHYLVLKLSQDIQVNKSMFKGPLPDLLPKQSNKDLLLSITSHTLHLKRLFLADLCELWEKRGGQQPGPAVEPGQAGGAEPRVAGQVQAAQWRQVGHHQQQSFTPPDCYQSTVLSGPIQMVSEGFNYS